MTSNRPLRPYQTDCVESVLHARKRGRLRVLYVMATGLGKTRVFSEIVLRLRRAGRPALVIAHREELIRQAADSIRAELGKNAHVGIEMGGEKASPMCDAIVASVQTLARSPQRLRWLQDIGPSVVVVDEAHHIAADGYQDVLQRFGVYDGRSFLVGCTATNYRLDNKVLVAPDGQATFEETVFEYGILDGIEGGFLSPVRGLRVRTDTDLSGVATRGGDFSAGELAQAIDNEKRTAHAIKQWQEHAGDRKTIVFCASVEHAMHAAEGWRELAGVESGYVHGGMTGDQRRAVIGAYRSGEIQVLTNCQVLTEGFDDPPTSCIVLLRPTQSWSLYVQMAGRGTRLSPRKDDCLVIDVVDSTKRHKLCTASSLLGLPATLDLEGGDLLEAKHLLDELEEKRGYLPAGYTADTLSELVSAVEKVNLFAEVRPRPEVRKCGGRMNWLWTGDGYRVGCGTCRETNARRMATLTNEALGWTLTLTETPVEKNGVPRQKQFLGNNLGDTDFPDFYTFEGILLFNFPYAGATADQNATWRTAPMSDKQRKLLKRHGIGDDVLNKLNKGEASAMIDRVMAEKAKAPVAA